MSPRSLFPAGFPFKTLYALLTFQLSNIV
jgi:hypothetical protein